MRIKTGMKSGNDEINYIQIFKTRLISKFKDHITILLKYSLEDH